MVFVFFCYHSVCAYDSDASQQDADEWSIYSHFRKFFAFPALRGWLDTAEEPIPTPLDDSRDIGRRKPKLFDLPSSVFNEIIDKLDYQDLFRLMQVNKEMLDRVSDFAPGFLAHKHILRHCKSNLTSHHMNNFYNPYGNTVAQIYPSIVSDECLQSIAAFCSGHRRGYLKFPRPMMFGIGSVMDAVRLKQLYECDIDLHLTPYSATEEEYEQLSVALSNLGDNRFMGLSLLGHQNLTLVRVEAVSSLFKKKNNLIRRLHISSTGFYDKTALKAFFRALSSPHCHIEKLSIRFISIYDGSSIQKWRQIGDFADNIEELSKIVTTPGNRILDLSLKGLNIDNRGMLSLAAAFQSPNNLVKMLDISENMLTKNGEYGFSRFCEVLGYRTQQHLVLKMRKTALTHDDLETLTQKTLQVPSNRIVGLDISQNKLSFRGFSALFDGIQHTSTKLGGLILRGVNMKDPSCISLARSLSSPHTKLQILDLSINHLGSFCAEKIGKSLNGTLSKVQLLDLSQNNIDNKGALALSRVLRNENNRLNGLALRHNWIKWNIDLLSAFIVAMRNDHCKLRYLGLAGQRNEVSSVFWRKAMISSAEAKQIELHLDTTDSLRL